MSSNSSPSMETAIRRAIEAALRGVSVCEPGQVLAYDAATLTADVQPLLLKSVQGETGSELIRQTPVTHAPVLWIGGGGSRLTFPVEPGDQCLLIIPSRPIDQWSALGTEVDPKNKRRHHMTDAIALVGLQAPGRAKAAHATATVLEGDDIRLGDADTAALLALKSDLTTLKSAISGTVVVANDGGASFKATLLTALSSWPVGTTKVKGS